MTTKKHHLYCPIPQAVNPHALHEQARSLVWARRRALFPANDLQRFRRARFSLLASLTSPTASPQDLALISDFLAWIFAHDDALDSTPMGRDPERAMTYAANLARVMRGDRIRSTNPRVTALLEIRRRLQWRTSEAWLERFAKHFEHYLLGNLLEARFRHKGGAPNPANLLQVRLWAGAIEPCLDLAMITRDIPCDRDFLDHPALRDLFLAVNEHHCWVNDLFAIDRELAEDKHVVNLVYILSRERYLSFGQALTEAAALCDEKMREILLLMSSLVESGELPDALLRPVLDALRATVRGNLDWYDVTARYSREALDRTSVGSLLHAA